MNFRLKIDPKLNLILLKHKEHLLEGKTSKKKKRL
jgi:hypothetical protein